MVLLWSRHLTDKHANLIKKLDKISFQQQRKISKRVKKMNCVYCFKSKQQFLKHKNIVLTFKVITNNLIIQTFIQIAVCIAISNHIYVSKLLFLFLLGCILSLILYGMQFECEKLRLLKVTTFQLLLFLMSTKMQKVIKVSIIKLFIKACHH